MKLAKLKYRIYLAHFEKVLLARTIVGTEKYDQCPIHMLVFMPGDVRAVSPRAGKGKKTTQLDGLVYEWTSRAQSTLDLEI